GVAVQQRLQLAEYAGPRRQVVERGIGRVPAIGVGLAPGAAGRVLVGQHAAGDFQFGPEIFETRVCAKRRLKDRSREQVTERHWLALAASEAIVKRPECWRSAKRSDRNLRKDDSVSFEMGIWGAKL